MIHPSWIGTVLRLIRRNFRLLFSNPWQEGSRVSSTILKNITSLSGKISYSQRMCDNFTTLSTSTATPDGIIQGLLYTPDLDLDDPCYNLADTYIQNATRQANLPPTTYNLIALAPWINADCTRSFLASARTDQLRAFVFYLPSDNTTSQPPDSSDLTWSLDDDDSWKSRIHYPVYAISGASGSEMMRQLSLYSGDLTEVPFGANISAIYNPDPADYVRIWTELSVSSDPVTLPLWVYLIIIIGVLLAIVGGTSMLMHYIQGRRRAALRRRVMLGELDLEALGIKRVTIPMQFIQRFPLFTYNYEISPFSPTSPQLRSSHRGANWQASENPSKINRVLSEKETATDFQPMCHICLEDFESKITIIRELPCGHIFHPECIDEFLNEVSSLCPICKKSMLPRGYCPKVTNGMVRREKATRRLRPRVTVRSDSVSSRIRIHSWSSSVKKRLWNAPRPPTQPIELPERRKNTTTVTAEVGTSLTRQRMQELAAPMGDQLDQYSDDGKPPWKRAVVRVFPGFS